MASYPSAFTIKPPPQSHQNDRSDSNKTSSSTSTARLKFPAAAPIITLPIDKFEPDIISQVNRNRVTVIHGETGCGKSSRVPVFLLNAGVPPRLPSTSNNNSNNKNGKNGKSPSSPQPQPSNNTRLPNETRVFVSQPRRIAARALTDRVRSTLPSSPTLIGMRLGHGVKDEYPSTRLFFVTTGYLVRLLAHHPESFDGVTHLVIDEVHERSVDTDILCLLAKRLLHTNLNIRLILMSATLAAGIYKAYFNLNDEPIHIKARTFEISFYYIKDLMKMLPQFHTSQKSIGKLNNIMSNAKPGMQCSRDVIQSQYDCVTAIIDTQISLGTTVLIFVTGMNDIVELTEKITNLSSNGNGNSDGREYVCSPIHSDIPFDDQMTAFTLPTSLQIKCVIATNAAESSVTLPACDNVICLGMCKQMQYDVNTHRQCLTATWISRASSKQRAGRTGRVRCGRVFRLYSRDFHDRMMDEYETGELLRTPLDSVILNLKAMLNSEVVPILEECIEPPDTNNIAASFEHLANNGFIEHASDKALLTTLGSFVSGLGVDLAIGRFIGLSAQFGLLPESIYIASVLNSKKSPWKAGNPLVNPPFEFNNFMSRSFLSMSRSDAGCYSEPFAAVNLMLDYEGVGDNAGAKRHFCNERSVSTVKINSLVSTASSLRTRICGYLNIDPGSGKHGHGGGLRLAEGEGGRMNESKMLIIRVIMVWSFGESYILHMSPDKSIIKTHDLKVNFEFLNSKDMENQISEEQLELILPSEQVSYATSNNNNNARVTYQMSCDIATVTDISSAIKSFRDSSIKKNCDMALFAYKSTSSFASSIDSVSLKEDIILVFLNTQSKHAGNMIESLTEECGLSHIATDGNENIGNYGFAYGVNSDFEDDDFDMAMEHVRKKVKAYLLIVEYKVFSMIAVSDRVLVTASGGVKTNEDELTGLFFGAKLGDGDKRAKTKPKPVFKKMSNQVTQKQQLIFHRVEEKETDVLHHLGTFTDIPLGARLLNQLAKGRRKEQSVHFPQVIENNVDVNVPATIVKFTGVKTRAWSMIENMSGRPGLVFLPSNSVVCALWPVQPPNDERNVYAICTSRLDLVGGGAVVENVTVLPLGEEFIMKAFLSFGRNVPVDVIAARDARNNYKNNARGRGKKGGIDIDTSYVTLAAEFDVACRELGEDLTCVPSLVEKLCELFNVDVWDNVGETISIVRNAETAPPELKLVGINSNSNINSGGSAKKDKNAKNLNSNSNSAVKAAKKAEESKAANDKAQMKSKALAKTLEKLNLNLNSNSSVDDDKKAQTSGKKGAKSPSPNTPNTPNSSSSSTLSELRKQHASLLKVQASDKYYLSSVSSPLIDSMSKKDKALLAVKIEEGQGEINVVSMRIKEVIENSGGDVEEVRGTSTSGKGKKAKSSGKKQKDKSDAVDGLALENLSLHFNESVDENISPQKSTPDDATTNRTYASKNDNTPKGTKRMLFELRRQRDAIFVLTKADKAHLSKINGEMNELLESAGGDETRIVALTRVGQINVYTARINEQNGRLGELGRQIQELGGTV